MTKTEVLFLELACGSLFRECGDYVQISMALSGKLKVEFEGHIRTNCITFDINGQPDCIEFTGRAENLFNALAVIKSVCADEENRKMLERLKWSYEHLTELTEVEDG